MKTFLTLCTTFFACYTLGAFADENERQKTEDSEQTTDNSTYGCSCSKPQEGGEQAS